MIPRVVGWMVALAAIAAGTGLVISRRWMQSWGTTEAELRRPLSGDNLISIPRYHATRAITIRSRAAAIWPWLVQIGQARGGFYSHDWIENLIGLDIHSADRIIPAFQHLEVGDIVRLAPNSGMVVAVLEPSRALVIRSVADLQTRRPVDRSDPRFFDWSWAFVLSEIDEQTTRLIVRVRADFYPSAVMTLLGTVVFGPVDFVMSRKMLQGIRQRAERSSER